MKYKVYWRLLVLILFLGAVPAEVSAQTAGRSYMYQDIDVTIRVNRDTTFDVEESQLFDYHGEYHQGWRSIPLKKIDAITDVQVMDGEANVPLQYVSKRLDKTDPTSWGKYTFYRENGAVNIEWYYNLKDTQHRWKIVYKVHGGLAFYDDFDELYWNVFTDYDVPVAQAEVIVVLPEATDVLKMRVIEYLSGGGASSSQIIDSRTFSASATEMKPEAMLTVAAGWPKGMVDEQAYWLGFLRMYWGYIASAVILVGTVIWCFVYWFFSEKFRKGRGVIIPQYEPPKGLPPAMGEVVVREGVSRVTWAATLVDLAVRGFVKIEEEPENKLLKTIATAFRFLLPSILAVLLVVLIGFDTLSFVIAFGVLIATWKMRSNFNLSKEYRITRVKLRPDFDRQTWREYEKSFLDAIFRWGDVFSTRDIRESPSKRAQMYESLKEVEKCLYEESSALGIYSVSVAKEKASSVIVISGGIVLVTWALLVSKEASFMHLVSLFLALVISGLLILYFLKIEARLNDAGNIFREEWLGFKLYLETAERYRMQNLTPDIFEKYLPYAIMFRVEKQWAKAFESLNMMPPQWYSGGSGVYAGSSSVTTFSATGFSTSLSASLTSSLSNAGAGSGSGASGGGGSAGGGGGGGGGGAS